MVYGLKIYISRVLFEFNFRFSEVWLIKLICILGETSRPKITESISLETLTCTLLTVTMKSEHSKIGRQNIEFRH